MAAAASARTSPRHSRSRTVPPPARRRTRPEPQHRPPRPQPVQAPRPRATSALLRFAENRANGLLDWLLRGRLWVGCIGVLLAGIVFLNVTLLELNQEIARTSAKAGVIDRQNSELRMKLAGLDSSQRIIRLATRSGMVFPQAGDYHYLQPRASDGVLAARRAIPPRSATATGAATAAVQPGVTQPSTAAAGTAGAYRPYTATGTRAGTTTAAAASSTTPPTAASVAPHP